MDPDTGCYSSQCPLKIEVDPFTIALLRHPLIPVPTEDLLDTILPDLAATLYERRAALEEAPLKTDCLTSIHYLFSKALGIEVPLTFIGDMPQLLSLSGWDFHVVDRSEMRSGDLLFLKRKAESRLIVHVALVLNVDRIFHCKRDVGAVIESVSDVFETYEQEIKKDQLLYIDFRNKELRKEHSGCYLEVGDRV